MDLVPEIWRDKRILVTGHTGFKGSWLTLMLSEFGAKIIGLGLPAKGPKSLYADAKISSLLDSEYIRDIRDSAGVADVFQNEEIDYVFHLAAQAFVRNSVKDPLETITTNVSGTANVLLHGLNSSSLLGITIVTTDKVYKNHDWNWPYRESDELGGHDPYSASKAAAELIVRALVKTNNPREIPVSTARAGNVIGGGDWGEDRLVPDVMRALISSQALAIRNPNASRPWQYILDCLQGYMLLAQAHIEQKPQIPDSLNFGPKESMPVINLIDLFAEKIGKPLKYEIIESSIFEHKQLALDSHLAQNSLGWSPRYSLNESIKQTANWYRDFLDGGEAQELMRRQITQFKEGK